MDPGIKISILSELRIANGLASAGRADLGLQVLRIAIDRQREGDSCP
jgi:hypothetical protein